MEQSVTEATRRNIIDFMTSDGLRWAGRLREDEFLSRLYDLSKLPSHDHRLRTAAADIQQHRVNWQDWGDDWVFYDRRFNLLRCADAQFLGFLAETVHPVVRSDTEEVDSLVATYNQLLTADGWELAETNTYSGRIFVPRSVGCQVRIFDEPTGWTKVDRQLQEIRNRLGESQTEEHYQMIGLLCRKALISVAQEVFNRDHYSTIDGIEASSTDARRMLEAVFDAELAGGANEEARAHAKAAVRLALALQHKRTADFRMAALCAEATNSTVNLLAILSARRDRTL